MAGNFDGIKTRRLGVEIEMTGITRCAAAKAIQKVLGGSIDHEGGTYDKYTVGDDKATGAIAKAAAPVLCSIRGFGSCPGYSF